VSAYKSSFVVRCLRSPCMKPATHRVHDTYNKCVGEYCEKHADERIEELDRYERAVNRAPR
jgi:hypothetical protein